MCSTAESQQRSTTCSSLVSQWIPFTNSPRLIHPTMLLKIFFPVRQSQALNRATCRELSKWNLWIGFPRQPFPFYFQGFGVPKEICNRVIIHSSSKYIYVCVYMYIYINTNFPHKATLLQQSQLFHDLQLSKQSDQANLATDLLQMW